MISEEIGNRNSSQTFLNIRKRRKCYHFVLLGWPNWKTKCNQNIRKVNFPHEIFM